MSEMGKMFRDGEYIVRQGEEGNCMYVIQSGRVEVIQEKCGRGYLLAEMEAGDCFGEMALFERERRSASVRAKGEVWVLTLEQRSFLRRVHQDPSLAFRILEKMSRRIRDLDTKLVELSAEQSVQKAKVAGAGQ